MCLKKSVFILIQTTGVKIGTFVFFVFFAALDFTGWWGDEHRIKRSYRRTERRKTIQDQLTQSEANATQEESRQGFSRSIVVGQRGAFVFS